MLNEIAQCHVVQSDGPRPELRVLLHPPTVVGSDLLAVVLIELAELAECQLGWFVMGYVPLAHGIFFVSARLLGETLRQCSAALLRTAKALGLPLAFGAGPSQHVVTCRAPTGELHRPFNEINTWSSHCLVS